MVLYQKVFLTTFLKNINLSLNGDREVFLIYFFCMYIADETHSWELCF